MEEREEKVEETDTAVKRWWYPMHVRFFDKHEIRILEKMDPMFVYLFIRLLLESTPRGGRLRYNEKTPYTATTLALLFSLPPEKVEVGMKAILDLGLMERTEDETLFIPLAQTMTGCGSSGAKRTQEWRKRKRDEMMSSTAAPVAAPAAAPAARPSSPKRATEPSRPAPQPSALPAEDPLVDQHAPIHLKDVIYSANGLGIPEDYATNWYRYMAQQDWCYLSKGQSVKVTRTSFKATLRSFYDFDRRKVAAGKVPSVSCGSFSAPAAISDTAAMPVGMITEEYFMAKVIAMNKGITRSERITEYEARTIYADFRMCEWLNFKGERITPENLAYNIKTKQQFMRSNGDGGYDPSDYDPTDDPERKTPEYITRCYEHMAQECDKLDKERLAIIKDESRSVEERFEALNLMRGMHNEVLCKYLEYYKVGIAEYERKHGTKWPLKVIAQPYPDYEPMYLWRRNNERGKQWVYIKNNTKSMTGEECDLPQEALDRFGKK